MGGEWGTMLIANNFSSNIGFPLINTELCWMQWNRIIFVIYLLKYALLEHKEYEICN